MCVCVCMCVYVFVCICVYVCAYVCICVYVCILMCVHMYVCVCALLCVHVCICLCVYNYVCVCMCVHSYIRMCVHMCVCMCRTATKSEINRAYRDLAKQWHPDKHEGEGKKVAEKKFYDIAAAKEVLIDPGVCVCVYMYVCMYVWLIWYSSKALLGVLNYISSRFSKSLVCLLR